MLVVSFLVLIGFKLPVDFKKNGHVALLNSIAILYSSPHSSYSEISTRANQCDSMKVFAYARQTGGQMLGTSAALDDYPGKLYYVATLEAGSGTNFFTISSKPGATVKVIV